jgi:hypothetical protein
MHPKERLKGVSALDFPQTSTVIQTDCGSMLAGYIVAERGGIRLALLDEGRCVASSGGDGK